jgi:hypothetical protein
MVPWGFPHEIFNKKLLWNVHNQNNIFIKVVLQIIIIIIILIHFNAFDCVGDCVHFFRVTILLVTTKILYFVFGDEEYINWLCMDKHREKKNVLMSMYFV